MAWLFVLPYAAAACCCCCSYEWMDVYNTVSVCTLRNAKVWGGPGNFLRRADAETRICKFPLNTESLSQFTATNALPDVLWNTRTYTTYTHILLFGWIPKINKLWSFSFYPNFSAHSFYSTFSFCSANCAKSFILVGIFFGHSLLCLSVRWLTNHWSNYLDNLIRWVLILKSTIQRTKSFTPSQNDQRRKTLALKCSYQKARFSFKEFNRFILC